MKIGYARVSTLDQNLELQTDALSKAGCEKIFTDRASGAKDDRQGLIDAIEFCRKSDSLVVWKLDRLGRSLKHLIETINQLHEKKVGFVSVQESIDTTTSGGKLIFHVFGALAEFERELIRERTNAGLASARARGRLGGRPKAMTIRQIQMAKAMLAEVFKTTDSAWRGIGIIPNSGWRLNDKYRQFDAEAKFEVTGIKTVESPLCRSGEVLQGMIKPHECECFGKNCTPRKPLGATMVSSEGACAAYYNYGRFAATAK